MLGTLLSTLWQWVAGGGGDYQYDQSSALLYGWSSSLSEMRTRDIRRIAEKLGAAREELEKLLDKNELCDFTRSLINDEISHRGNEVLNARLWRWTLIALGVGLVVVLGKPILALSRGFVEYLKTVEYQVLAKYGLVKLSARHRLPLVCVSLVLAAALELVGPLMQISVMASWVLPSHSPLRSFLFPTISIPISADMIVNTVTGSRSSSGSSGSGGSSSRSGKSGSRSGSGSGSGSGSNNNISSSLSGTLGNLGSYGLNVGPMLTLMLVSYLKGRLENWAAKYLLDIVESRRRKKEQRRDRQRAPDIHSRRPEEEEEERWGSIPVRCSQGPDHSSLGGFSAFNNTGALPVSHGFPPPQSASRGALDMDEVLRHSKDDIFAPMLEGEKEGEEEGEKWPTAGSSNAWDEVD